MSQTPVQKWYSGKTIFVTGGSGFMGKVLLEKILYACSDIRTIYILIRPKRNKAPQARLEDWMKLPVFIRIKNEKPEVFKKLIAVQGDLSSNGLGLSHEDREKLVEETEIVFHCAATLKLEAKLKDAIEFNTTGTKRVLDLCKQMKKLQVMLHMSTAFCYCDKEVLNERVYDFHHNPYDLMRLAEWMDEKTLDQITPDLLKPHPNTYTYTKRLSECLVRDNYPQLPVCIVRPSIVCPANKEPVEGWVDNLNGPVGIMVAGGKGIMRSMLCNGEYNAEVIPVDIAINGLITIAYTMGQMKELPPEIPVYNVTCRETKRTTWKEVLEMGKATAYEYPFEAGIWYPDGDITTNKLYHTICVILFHWLPAYFIDFLMFCFGQKRFMCRLQGMVSQGLELLQFFTTRQWNFKSNQYQAIPQNLTPRDFELFDMDVDRIDTKDYIRRIVLGGRQYCMKEPLSSLPKARIQLKALYVLDKIGKAFMIWFLTWSLLSTTGLKQILSDLFTPK
ncbi:putative fatty acyl-CoA reductase CG5065 isoform X7 [Wyeomyia smithii]|uniref:putative fatty acyl-CoA reductase CG5065 isoform X7 n=1 Tax=Wyeomyia smithii TaxID=174621 RepID=UPI002467B95A|nr:putative fatty acyl-CoA reductase CG5065 isoform X7 [Wyeomyia smithii]XP_055548929.1 putative fatty acyl-CoA reductase CG5065 isoform X7 [Wyeomyia smithii]XP_055548930.1 putative fatty acyl-CoA reductase CG5065 isoform X7 [Wyeomyia smithii]